MTAHDPPSDPPSDPIDGAPAISACIVCCNEADRLADCLASLSWLSDVVVCDLGSVDDSVDVARRHGARVVAHPPTPVAELVRNHAATHARHDWILVIDPDERVTPGLACALSEAATDDGIDAVVLPRMNCDFGFEPAHWTQRYEPQLRMYRRSAVTWPEFPNRLPSVDPARTLRLPARDEVVLRHERSRTIGEVLERSMRVAPVQAQAMLDEGQEFTASAMASALWREVRGKAIHARAWRDGVPGLIRAGVLISFKFHVWAEFWRLSGAGRRAADAATVRRVGIASEAIRFATAGADRARRIARRATGAARRG